MQAPVFNTPVIISIESHRTKDDSPSAFRIQCQIRDNAISSVRTLFTIHLGICIQTEDTVLPIHSISHYNLRIQWSACGIGATEGVRFRQSCKQSEPKTSGKWLTEALG